MLLQPLPTLGQVRQFHASGGGQLAKLCHQRRGVELGTRVRAPQWRDALLARDRVLAGEQSVDGPIRGDAGEARPLRQGARPPAGRLALGRVVLAPIVGDLVEPVLFLAHSKRGDSQGPGKVAIRPVYPMTPHRGPAPRDCVGPGREPDSSDRHGRTYGADRRIVDAAVLTIRDW